MLVSAEQSKYVHILKACAHQEGENHEDERGSCCSKGESEPGAQHKRGGILLGADLSQ